MSRDSITLRAGGGELVIDATGVHGTPDVFAGNISLRRHRHRDVEPGKGTSGEPV